MPFNRLKKALKSYPQLYILLDFLARYIILAKVYAWRPKGSIYKPFMS
jgi:hypothetical protein